MAKFHFVEDYEIWVDSLLAQYPVDQAMAMAVGGDYDHVGQVEVELLRHAGLRCDMSVLDLGCGSGRLAHALGKSDLSLQYTGVDIIQKLLDYAATKCPRHFHFINNQTLSVPANSATIDIVCAFSLFTHLLHHETYIYVEDIHRVLRTDGKLVFSFIEFAAECHWPVFAATVEGARAKTSPHLNSFIERNVIALWASKLGFSIEGYIEATCSIGGMGALGQTTAILKRI